ncbi:hypothetical protein LBMAG52_31950 [Planctomycetia bacterium]|nr:hypothetical protein LBMAG52_31950 [Planctomycetia bacterium]
MHGESAAQLDSGFSSGLGIKRCKVEDPEFDVTAMVDLVSLMNIYFLVSWVMTMANEVDLPAAKNCVAGDPETSVMVIVKRDDDRGSKVVIGEDGDGEVLTDRAVILQKVTEAVKAGAKEAKPKDTLLIKAEREVPLKDISHIASAAAAAEGFKLRLAVQEKE